MDDDFDLPSPRRWPMLVALLASLLWLVIAGTWAAAPWVTLPGPLTAALPFIGAIINLVAPLALIWLLAQQLRDRSGAQAARAALLAEHVRITDVKIESGTSALVDLENRFETLFQRLEGIAAPVKAQHDALTSSIAGLVAAGSRLDGAAGIASAAATTLATAVPSATSEAERLTAALAEAETRLNRQIETSARLMADLAERSAAAEIQAGATTAAAQAGLTAIAAATATAEAALAQPLGDLNTRVDAAFQRSASAVDTTRDAIHAQTNAMLASVDQARVTLDHIGGEAARQIEARLQGMLSIAAQLVPAVADQAAQSQALLDDVARQFTVLDTKLANSAATGQATLDSIAAKLTEAREAIHRLGEPLAGTAAALHTVAGRLGEVSGLAGGALDALGEVDARRPLLDDMAARLSDLDDRAQALQAPIAAGGNSLMNARGLLEEARGALDSAAVKLVEQLGAARGELAEIEHLTGTASLAASTQLIEVFGRVRDVATQTAGTMRETLARVVEEAEQALSTAGEARAATAFGAPIRAQLAEVEATHDRVAAAAQTAAERVTQRLVGLVGTIADVEARIDRIETGFDVRARGTLARKSRALLDSLQRAAVDFAGLLAVDMADGDWDAYLKGDRSLFTRRVLTRLEGDSSRAIGRHFQHDPEFRRLATQFIDEFETLIDQVMNDRDGQSLATTLLGSHTGRLYLAIAHGAGRFADT